MLKFRNIISCCLGVLPVFSLSAQVMVEPSQIKPDKEKMVYEYTLSASDMIKGETFPKDAIKAENVTLHSNKGTLFISPNEGANKATIEYVFDFTKTNYRPTSVDWQYKFNTFGTPEEKKPAVVATVAWSTDGFRYHPLAIVSNDPDYRVPKRNPVTGAEVQLKHSPDKVYYRVQFKTVKARDKFVASQIQWNRTGSGAKLFNARFALEEVAVRRRKGDVSLRVTYPAKVKHLTGKQVYPEDLLGMNSVKYWRFLGAIHGTKGSVKEVDAPGRPGEKALLFSVTVKKTDKTPGWMQWFASLDPQLSVVGAHETEIDIYPVTPMPFRIMAMYGEHRGFGVIPVVWSSLGHHEPGKWHTLRMRVGNQQREIDRICFTFPTRQSELKDGEEVKFIVDNIRINKMPDPAAEVTIDKMTVGSGVDAGFVQMNNHTELKDNESMNLSMELGVARDTQAAFEVKVKNVDSGKTIKERLPVDLKAPFTKAEITITSLLKQVGPGKQEVAVLVVDGGGAELAASSRPYAYVVYSTDEMNAVRKKLLARMNRLMAWKQRLEKQGIVVQEPGVTLAVANWFLKDDGNVVDDFVRQGVCEIAYQQMDYLKGLLDEVEKQLRLREDGKVKEVAVDDYKLGIPVKIANGRLEQSGKPIFLIGALGSQSHTYLLRDIGFNSQSRETGINKWIAKSQETGITQFKEFFDISKKYGISTSMLLSSHYRPDPIPTAFEGSYSPHTGASMFPWDVCSPNIDKMFNLWYKRMMPYLKNEPSLVSLGTANEPGYSVDRESKTFEAKFREWSKATYKDIAAANQLWGSSFASFETIDLPTYFDIRKQSQAANYDWLRFVDIQVSGFFGRRKDYLLNEMPDMTVWVKLMGNHHHIGYPHLNEVQNILQGQNVAGTDGHAPMWLDLIKSVDPSRPIVNSEWHFLGGKIDMNDQALIQRRMVDGMTHGICNGLIWKWRRSEWNTKSNGAEQTLNRWARTIDAAGRAALKMRGQVGAISDLGNLDGGKVRLLYSISSTVKMGKTYAEEMQHVYDSLGRNSQGTRFLFSNLLSPEDLSGVSLLAASKTPCVETEALQIIEAWVKNGGTLWLTEPCMGKDPWDREHTGLPADFTKLLMTAGKHPYGKGQVLVDKDDSVVASHAIGPWAADATGKFNELVDIRYLAPKDGKPGYMSILNRGAEPTTITLTDGTGKWQKVASAQDVWNYCQVDLTKPLELKANDVMLLEVR